MGLSFQRNTIHYPGRPAIGRSGFYSHSAEYLAQSEDRLERANQMGVILSCKHTGYYHNETFNLIISGGYKPLTDKQYSDMVEIDKELWQRLLDNETIVVLKEGKKLPAKNDARVLVHNYAALTKDRENGAQIAEVTAAPDASGATPVIPIADSAIGGKIVTGQQALKDK